MSGLTACGQGAVLPDTCVECGGWLSRVLPGGLIAEVGRVCSEDCAADQTARLAEDRRNQHLRMRDLMCACPEFCAPAGLPSAGDLAEYAAYQRGLSSRE